jgi:ubiquinone/menaquinone biosynthesis C-methylase UbiE
MRELYDLWASTYPPLPHNPLMRAEQAAMLEEWPRVSGRTTLDLACGTGRYAQLLAAGAAAEVLALDLSEAMLDRVQVGRRVRASMMRLPFASGAFDVVISGLAVGHVPSLGEWMAELARVLVPGGVLLYSDFHPAAARAGMTRSFKDPSGRHHALPHICHEVIAHQEAAVAANLTIERVREARMGYELSEPFPGSEAVYRRWHGLPVVLVVRASRGAS